MARGSIVKREGKRKKAYYYAVYYVGTKQKWEKAPHPGRKEDAQRLLNQRLRELDQGEYREVQKTTFAEFSERWFSDYVDDPNHVKRSTRDAYRSMFKCRLGPFFNDYPLTQIGVELVQKFVSETSREGLAPKTINNHLIPLSAMFKAAMRQGYMKTSPMPLVQKPKIRRREMAILSAIETRHVLAQVCEDWRAFFTTAALTGMRLGELAAMRWDNLDWEAGVYSVRERLYEGHFDSPKSEAGRRAVDLSPSALEALKTHRAAQSAHKLSLGNRYADQDLVFCTVRGNPLHSTRDLRKAFNDALNAAGCKPIRIHDLRHGYAALLIAQNENPKYIQTQMGHASIQVTFDVYGHLMPDPSREAVKRLDEQIFGASH